MEAPDTTLIEQVRGGDSAAFDQLVARHRDRMHRQLYSLCMDTEQIEDTVQETFLQAFRALNQFRGLSAFSTWLYRIAHNICLRKRQQARRHMGVSLEEMAESDEESAPRELSGEAEDPEETVISQELKTAMDRAVADLPASYRDVFVYRVIEELPTEEAGRLLGLTEAAVKARLHRARHHLKQSLASYLGGE